MVKPLVATETLVKTPDAELEVLRKQVAELSAKLKASEEKLATNEGFSVLQREITEIPTGEKIAVKRIKSYDIASYRDDGRPVYRPVFHEVEVPTYRYRVDLPASGGQGVRINDTWYYQDETYTLDLDVLRTVKDIVHRAWAHEATIKGNNENVFRRPRAQTLSGRGVRG
jgi:hypothetical protein